MSLDAEDKQWIQGLVETLLEGLETRMLTEFHNVNTRLDTQAVRMDRQGGFIQAGNRWSGRLNAWSEKIDQAMEKKDQELLELRRRLDALERKSPSQ